MMAIPYLSCMALVASLYALPPRVLPSIQAVEGGRPGEIHRNADDSEDYGIMQVNSGWLAPLVRYTGLPRDVVRERLLDRDCFNIAAAGAIMRSYLDEAHGDLMTAIGDYHSHTPNLNHRYQLSVRRAAALLFGSRK